MTQKCVLMEICIFFFRFPQAFLAQYSRTEPASITRRREVEDARAVLNDRVTRDFQVNAQAKWENRTHAMIQTQAVAQVARQLKQRDQVALQQRRARLAMLLTDRGRAVS